MDTEWLTDLGQKLLAARCPEDRSRERYNIFSCPRDRGQGSPDLPLPRGSSRSQGHPRMRPPVPRTLFPADGDESAGRRGAGKRGEAVVNAKAKTRTVFIVKALKQKLLRYAAEQGITAGMIFITRTGRPVDRTNIWREMKGLCEQADVNPQKVFPHNLRHLFARVFYGIEKDIAKLADILGHSSINTTRIYIISTGDEHRRRMENMRLIL